MPPANFGPVQSYASHELEARRDAWYPSSPTNYKNRNELRDYQVAGLNWLIKCFLTKKNGLLADEMGLGKTVQLVAYMEHLRFVEGIRGPFLVFFLFCFSSSPPPPSGLCLLSL